MFIFLHVEKRVDVSIVVICYASNSQNIIEEHESCLVHHSILHKMPTV